MTALRKITHNALLLLIGFALIYGTFIIATAAAQPGSGSATATLDAAHGSAMAVYDAAPATGEAPGAPAADPPIPDPIDDTGGYVGEVTSSFQRGAYLPVALLLMYGLITVLARYVAWLKVGWRKVAVTVATAALGTAVTALAQGAAPTLAWAINIVGGAVLIALNGKGDPAPAKS